jgi:hypothetical protein
VIERGHLEEGGNDVKALAKQALGIFARKTGGHFNSESLVPLEVGIWAIVNLLPSWIETPLPSLVLGLFTRP